MCDPLSDPGGAPLRGAESPWNDFEEKLTRLFRRTGSTGAMELAAPTEPTGGDGRSGRARCRVHLAPHGPSRVTVLPAGRALTEELVARCEPVDPSRLAAAVVDACLHQLGVPHPQLLTLRCEGPVGRLTGPLRLLRSDSVPVGEDPADYPHPADVAVEVTDHEDARERYETLVERVTGRPCVVDDDGDLVFDHVGRRMHIEFTEDVPYARIWAWVVRGVRSGSAAALEVARLNLEDDLTAWVLDGRHVLQRTTVPVAPFLPRHAQAALEHFLYTFACTHESIERRIGPR